jgi:hypothetical protein
MMLEPPADTLDVDSPARIPVFLGEMWELDGQLYRFSSTAAGDRMTVSPYRGEFGVAKVGSGKGDAAHSLIEAWVHANNGILVCGRRDASGECRLPVGDYLLNSATEQRGDFRIEFNPFTSSDPTDGVRGRSADFKVAIRKEKPFVFDFGNSPKCVIVSPKAGATIEPNGSLELVAALVDPVLGISMTVKTPLKTSGERAGKSSDDVPFWASLRPTAAIRNSTGRGIRWNFKAGMVSEGRYFDVRPMPEALRTAAAAANGKPVPLTLTVTFDTGELFGKVEASCPIVLSPSKK